jgi:tRNA threonylcarbamoyladenosine biosynthesis protein TsaB
LENQSLNILSIESSTAQCSVALRVQSQSYERKVNAIGTHSSAIFTQIQDVLSEAGINLSDVNSVIVGRGPGSYTGLRVAVSAVKGLLFGRDVEFYSANTLASFAACIPASQSKIRVHSIIDARRKHLYWQPFYCSIDSIIPENEPVIIEIEVFYDKIGSGDMIIGTGIERLDESRLKQVSVLPIDQTSAIGLIRLMDIADKSLIHLEDIREFEPNYITSDA